MIPDGVAAEQRRPGAGLSIAVFSRMLDLGRPNSVRVV
ncbi:hypothetical protein FH063_003206 [Azospirillum argentinense]|uniref:Uncharacterized protein n=1 Tax=Azospirillum argentinense TaxID=2970906 RepID=A0A5B0KN89_9PROT|nr:hypothetical protein FH063_003206 [Azospirillum argentinense]